MNINVRGQSIDQQATRLAVVDCDIHPQMRAASDLFPFLSERWRTHMQT